MFAAIKCHNIHITSRHFNIWLTEQQYQYPLLIFKTFQLFLNALMTRKYNNFNIKSYFLYVLDLHMHLL